MDRVLVRARRLLDIGCAGLPYHRGHRSVAGRVDHERSRRHQRRVTSEFGQFFSWSPDGSAIIVAGANEMYLIRPDGSGLTPFPVEGVPHPLFPDWIAP
jgi:hypothetical protein